MSQKRRKVDEGTQPENNITVSLHQSPSSDDNRVIDVDVKQRSRENSYMPSSNNELDYKKIKNIKKKLFNLNSSSSMISKKLNSLK